MLDIVELTARKLGCKESSIFLKVTHAIEKTDLEASVWLSMYIETKKVSPEVVNWCLAVLYPPKVLQEGGVLT